MKDLDYEGILKESGEIILDVDVENLDDEQFQLFFRHEKKMYGENLERYPGESGRDKILNEAKKRAMA